MSEILTELLIKKIEDLDASLSILKGVDSTQLNETIKTLNETVTLNRGAVNTSYKGVEQLNAKLQTAFQNLEKKLEAVNVPEQVNFYHSVKLENQFFGFSGLNSLGIFSFLILAMFLLTGYSVKSMLEFRGERERIIWEKDVYVGFGQYYKNHYQKSYEGLLKEYKASKEYQELQEKKP